MADTKRSATINPGQQKIGTVYAKALLGAAEKAGQTEAVLSELESVLSDVLDKLPQFHAALISPRIGHDVKAGMLDRAFAAKMSPVLLNFLKVVARHGRLDCLRAIALACRRLLNEIRGRVEVQLRTASPLSNPLKEQITQRLTRLLGKEVVLKAQLDPEILGGLIVRVGDTLFDGSVTARLAGMRAAAVEKTAARFRESLDRFAVPT